MGNVVAARPPGVTAPRQAAPQPGPGRPDRAPAHVGGLAGRAHRRVDLDRDRAGDRLPAARPPPGRGRGRRRRPRRARAAQPAQAAGAAAHGGRAARPGGMRRPPTPRRVRASRDAAPGARLDDLADRTAARQGRRRGLLHAHPRGRPGPCRGRGARTWPGDGRRAGRHDARGPRVRHRPDRARHPCRPRRRDDRRRAVRRRRRRGPPRRVRPDPGRAGPGDRVRRRHRGGGGEHPAALHLAHHRGARQHGRAHAHLPRQPRPVRPPPRPHLPDPLVRRPRAARRPRRVPRGTAAPRRPATGRGCARPATTPRPRTAGGREPSRTAA